VCGVSSFFVSTPLTFVYKSVNTCKIELYHGILTGSDSGYVGIFYAQKLHKSVFIYANIHLI
jgi:hypothetical protein